MYETLKFTEMTTRRVIDAKDKDGEKVYVKGHAKATYMSDGRTVEDAINQLGTGGGGSSAYPRIDYMWTAGSETISPNTFHVWGSVTGLSIEFGEEISGVANEYLFQFTCDLHDEPVITLPDTIVWANGEPTFDSGGTYQVSVLNGIGLVVENKIIIG